MRSLRSGGQHFADGQVVAVSRGRRVVDADCRAGGRGGRILPLHPVGVPDRRKVLMHQHLARPGRPANRVIVIVANPQHPGTVAGRYQAGCRRPLAGVAAAGSPDRPRPVGTRGVHALKAHDRKRRRHILGKGGRHRDVAQRRGRKGLPDFRGAALDVGAAHQCPGQPASRHTRDGRVGPRKVIGRHKGQKQFIARRGGECGSRDRSTRLVERDGCVDSDRTGWLRRRVKDHVDPVVAPEKAVRGKHAAAAVEIDAVAAAACRWPEPSAARWYGRQYQSSRCRPNNCRWYGRRRRKWYWP